MKKVWLISLAAVILVLCLAAGLFWDTLIIYISPKAALSGALTKTISALQERASASPVPVLSNGFDREGKNTIDLELDTPNELLGNIHYNMKVMTENNPRRIAADGLVTSNAGILDLSLYFDPYFTALSSKSLLEGNYYGITYDTFSEDIHLHSLLAFLIGEETISQWESSLNSLQNAMGVTYEPPQFSSDDIRSALFGILALEAKVSRETMPIGGTDQACYKISFASTGEELSAIAENYAEYLSPEQSSLLEQFKNDPNSSISASFYMFEGNVVKICCTIQLQSTIWNASMSLGSNAAKDDIVLELSSREGQQETGAFLSVSTEYNESTYTEKLSLLETKNNTSNRTLIDYHWNRNNGDLRLTVTQGAEDTSLRGNLRQTENGFRLSTDQAEVLLGLLMGQEKTGNSTCTMFVSKGASIQTPTYKNLDQWSTDDLLTLLEGIGSLFGLKIP